MHVHILWKYPDFVFRQDIEHDISAESMSEIMVYDLERVLNDFHVLFFVGNDVFYHLPTLEIRESAIDFLIELYKS